jgi:hypothetical protein
LLVKAGRLADEERKGDWLSSGICLEIAALPFLGGWFGYETSWYLWL